MHVVDAGAVLGEGPTEGLECFQDCFHRTFVCTHIQRCSGLCVATSQVVTGAEAMTFELENWKSSPGMTDHSHTCHRGCLGSRLKTNTRSIRGGSSTCFEVDSCLPFYHCRQRRFTSHLWSYLYLMRRTGVLASMQELVNRSCWA